jgi:iron complex transport system substrate-binding protein
MHILGRNLVFFLVLSGWPWLAAQAESVSVIDDEGQTVSLTSPAVRIISLSPHITELVFAAGAGDKLVGVVEYSDFPEAAKSIERIGNHSSIDLERISTLKPDLIIAWNSGNPKAAIEKLKQLGYPLFLSEPRSLKDIVTTMHRFSKLANTEAVASKAIVDFEKRYAQIKEKYQSNDTVTVFYEIWYQPMMTIGGGHIINEVIETCGGSNVFARLSALAPKISIESILAANPQVILGGSNIGDKLFVWRRWSRLDASRYKNLFHVEWDHINRHSPRILDAVVEVCDALNVARKNIQSAEQSKVEKPK